MHLSLAGSQLPSAPMRIASITALSPRKRITEDSFFYVKLEALSVECLCKFKTVSCK